MKPFHVSLHARPPGHWPEELLLVEGRSLTRLVVPPEQLNEPLPLSFEQAAATLSAWPRMFLEPDGSFVWVDERAGTGRWQVDGVLWDRGGRLQYVELSGNCTAAAFNQLVRAIGVDASSTLLVQLLRHAILVDAADFCRFQFVAG